MTLRDCSRMSHRPFHVRPDGFDFAVTTAEWRYQGIIPGMQLREFMPTAYLRVSAGVKIVGLPSLFVHADLVNFFKDDVTSGYFEMVEHAQKELRILPSEAMELMEDSKLIAVSREWQAVSGEYLVVPMAHLAVPLPGVSFMDLAPAIPANLAAKFLTGEIDALPPLTAPDQR